MALKDKLMTLEDFKAVRDVDVASNTAQFTEIKADLDDNVNDLKSATGNIADRLDAIDGEGYIHFTNHQSITFVDSSHIWTYTTGLNKYAAVTEDDMFHLSAGDKIHVTGGVVYGVFYRKDADGAYGSTTGASSDYTALYDGMYAISATLNPQVNLTDSEFKRLVSYFSIIRAEYALKDINATLTEQREDINMLSAGLKDNTATDAIPMIDGKYFNLTGSTVTITNNVPVPSNNDATYKCGYMACSPGDVFTVSGLGGNAARLWGFISSSGTVLSSKADAGANETNKTVIAPTSAAWIIINTKNDLISYKGTLVQLRLSALETNSATKTEFNTADSNTNARIDKTNTDIINITGNTPVDMATGKYINLTGASVTMSDGVPQASNSDANYSYGVIQCVAGDIITVNGKGGGAARLWGFVKSDGTVLDYKANADAVGSNTMIVAPVGAAWAIINTKAGGISYKGTLVYARLDTIESDILNNPTSGIGNCTIRCAKEQSFTDGSHPVIQWYLLEKPGSVHELYYSKDLIHKRYLTTFDGDTYMYSWGILQNGDIIVCRDASSINKTDKNDANRVNPYVYLASEGWKVRHEVNFGSAIKPCGWLQNSGFKVLANGSAIWCEYTRQSTATANVWKLSGDPLDPNNWVITKSFPITTEDNLYGFKHCHMISQDFYTGVCYFSTGDDDAHSMMFASTDNGSTWTQLVSPDSSGTNDLGYANGSQIYCRNLTLTFTKDYIYWSTDAPEAVLHKILCAGRDANGVLDFSHCDILATIPEVSSLATYGTVLIPELNAILLLERSDSGATEMPVRLFTLEDNELHTLGILKSINNGVTNIGFRTRFSEWYPNDCKCHIGYELRQNGWNDCVNRIAAFGNNGYNVTGYGANNINNLVVKVYFDGTNYGMVLDTIYV